MKIYAAAIATVALLGVAIAQTTPVAPPAPPATPTAEYAACPALPADPTGWPDGATAKSKDMESGQKRYSDWETAIAGVVTCKRAAQQKAKAAAEATTAAFNEDATRVNAVRAAWKSEADEFMARQPAKAKDNREGR
jgi:hypothetical protein